ncbi:Uncharacterised protein [Mycobacteroides abscessus subsp. abscessus]|nr:Uncharacterised protein [Mycobacteroides abscessus subsp. abscessus]
MVGNAGNSGEGHTRHSATRDSSASSSSWRREPKITDARCNSRRERADSPSTPSAPIPTTVIRPVGAPGSWPDGLIGAPCSSPEGLIAASCAIPTTVPTA